jgi:hypothetical protein
MGTHDAHPHLSAAERDSLAGQIASMDGVSFPQAQRQIEEFVGTDLDGTIPAPAEFQGSDEEETLAGSPTNECIPLACAT